MSEKKPFYKRRTFWVKTGKVALEVAKIVGPIAIAYFARGKKK